MQTSSLPSAVEVKEDAGHSQKVAQSEGFSSLASACTGMMSTFLHGSNTGSKSSMLCTFGEKSNAAHRYDVLLEEGSCLDQCSSRETDVSHSRKRSFLSLRENVGLLCSVTVALCLGSTALGFCVHLHYENQMFQTMLQNLTSLRRDYQVLRDDNQKLRNELGHHMGQNKLTTEASEEDDRFSSDNGHATQPSGDLSQVLRVNGLPQSVSDALQRRAKRNAANDRHYIERIVINFLRRMPKVHLKGINNISNDREYRGPQNEYLVWQPDSEAFIHRGVTLRHVHHQHNRVNAIEIEQTGVYIVYSQVIINGTTNSTWRRDCAQQTVVVPYHDDNNRDDISPPSDRVLLSGFLTQDSEGRYENSNIPFPRDSSLQMGMFRLIRQSQVRVRVRTSDDCRRTIITTDLHSSYFGLYRIA